MKPLLFLLTLCTAITSYAQDIKIIKLKPVDVAHSLINFHISGVIDDREDTADIGSMNTGFFKKITTINLKGGAAAAISSYIHDHVDQNKKTPAIEMHITHLNISESAKTFNERVDIRMSAAFYEDSFKMVEYTETAYAQTTRDAGSYVEGLIRQCIEGLLKEFDNWKEQNNYTAGVNTEVHIDTTPDNNDLIYFSKNRPLTLKDFQATPDDLSLGVALTASGVGMSYSHQKFGNSVTLKINLYCYFDKSKSWCKPAGKNALTLEHEQLHFDISAIKFYAFAEKLKAYKFSPGNYLKELNDLLKEVDKETAGIQQQYDKETKHGTITAKQKQWDTDIKAQLADVKM